MHQRRAVISQAKNSPRFLRCPFGTFSRDTSDITLCKQTAFSGVDQLLALIRHTTGCFWVTCTLTCGDQHTKLDSKTFLNYHLITEVSSDALDLCVQYDFLMMPLEKGTFFLYYYEIFFLVRNVLAENTGKC